MVRTVYAEEKILPDLIRISKTDGYIPGLILGQCSGQRDYVIHLARTPLPSEKTVTDGSDLNENASKLQRRSVDKLTDIQEMWLADHAKQVTRMLPGGMWVLGVFVVGPGDIFAETTSLAKLNSILINITKHLNNNRFFCGNTTNTNKLLLHLSTDTQRHVCKSFDVSNLTSSLQPVDWKFQGNHKWYELECQYDFDLLIPYQITEAIANLSLKKHLQRILHKVSDGVQKAVCTIDGEIRDDSDSLEFSDKSKKGRGKTSGEKLPAENKPLQVNLYIPCDMEVKAEDELNVVEVVGEMNCSGVLSSKVFLHQKARVEEAVKAVKEDIIRSWAARLEMHWDSLIEEDASSPEEVMVVHEPPRRVLIPLPHSKVALSDYLFPGEGPSEALISLQELLGVKVNESAVQKDFEGQPDPSDLYNLTANMEPTKSEERITSNSAISPLIISALVLAFVFLITSILVQFYMK